MAIGTTIEPTLTTARAPIPAIATSGPASSGREIDANPFSVSFVPMARPRSFGPVVSAIKATAATLPHDQPSPTSAGSGNLFGNNGMSLQRLRQTQQGLLGTVEG